MAGGTPAQRTFEIEYRWVPPPWLGASGGALFSDAKLLDCEAGFPVTNIVGSFPFGQWPSPYVSKSFRQVGGERDVSRNITNVNVSPCLPLQGKNVEEIGCYILFPSCFWVASKEFRAARPQYVTGSAERGTEAAFRASKGNSESVD